jgi:hypothetical protein
MWVCPDHTATREHKQRMLTPPNAPSAGSACAKGSPRTEPPLHVIERLAVSASNPNTPSSPPRGAHGDSSVVGVQAATSRITR